MQLSCDSVSGQPLVHHKCQQSVAECGKKFIVITVQTSVIPNHEGVAILFLL